MIKVNPDQYKNYADDNFNIITLDINLEADSSKISFNGRDNVVVIGKDVSLKGNIQFEGDNGYLFIDDDSKFIGDIIIGGGGCSVRIGKNFDCVGHVFITVAEKTTVTVGNKCMFNGNIQIRTHDSHPIWNVDSHQRVNNSQSIHIGDKVWVGNSVKILKGVSIGDYSIVGMDSVVTKNVPNNSLAVGIPAEIKKNDIFWTSASLTTKPFPDL